MLTNLKKTNSGKTKRYFCIIAALVIIISVIVISVATPGIKWFFTPKAKAADGVLENTNGAEHISEVPQGEIKYLINNNVVLENDNLKGSFMFENPEACEYTLQFVVYQVVGDENDENILYTSPMIEPGQFVAGDKLDKKLAAGKYDCLYFARAYLDGEYIGEKSGDMTVTVLE